MCHPQTQNDDDFVDICSCFYVGGGDDPHAETEDAEVNGVASQLEKQTIKENGAEANGTGKPWTSSKTFKITFYNPNRNLEFMKQKISTKNVCNSLLMFIFSC